MVRLVSSGVVGLVTFVWFWCGGGCDGVVCGYREMCDGYREMCDGYGEGCGSTGFWYRFGCFLADGPTCGEVSISGVLWPEFCGHKKFFGDLLIFLHFFFFIKRCVAGFGGCVCVSAKCQM